MVTTLRLPLPNCTKFDSYQTRVNQLLLTQNVQISIVFHSVKSIIMKIKEWHHVFLTSNISGKTWSNCTCRGYFENVRTSRFQICTWFWKLTKICGSNRAKQNIQLFVPVLYIWRCICRIRLDIVYRLIVSLLPKLTYLHPI